MMYKRINIDPFFNETDELSVKLIDLSSLEKTAAVFGTHVPEEITAYVKGIRPENGSVYAHVIAVSADEFYGSNRNGDAFKENDLLGEQDEGEAARNPEPYTGKKLQRYKTFLTAKFFKHHVNKADSPSFGSVVCVAYNMKMHRVELVIKVDKFKAPDFVERLEAGKPIALSMGCKVPYDICSICGNKAKSRADYCEHAKTMMNKILEDGKQVKVLNTKPRFFDISDVLIPADEQAFVLKKVASFIFDTLGYDPEEYYEDDDMEVLATAFKSAEIDKKIDGEAIGDAVKNVNHKLMTQASRSEPDIAPEDLDRAAESCPYRDIMSTMTNMGMVLKPAEHRRIVIIKITKNPDFLKESSFIDLDSHNKTVYNIFRKYAAARSCYTDHLIKRASALSNNSETPVVDTDHISDGLYKIYREGIMKVSAKKLVSNIETLNNDEAMFKGAMHWTIPTAAVPLAAAYMYGAHQDYKRRYKGEPLTKFQEEMADKPGKHGVAGAAAALLLRGLLRGKKITIK